ncbi:uncharacterized protein LOC126842247 [Adelges cooleyi]|uniref:uncharacterized protein LOC126842247 n=1 Tax=Adelges cooleyi TaxID=133065 RepID=UPI00217F2689|nr:uncharacterized protein LOC126842247 [Adelges cooleyi]
MMFAEQDNVNPQHKDTKIYKHHVNLDPFLVIKPEVLKRYNMLKIKQENYETEEHSFDKSFEVIKPKPLYVQFKNNEKSTTEEYFSCNNDDLNIKIEKERFDDCVFESEIEIVRHELFDAEEEPTPSFDCNYCQKSFKTKQKIKKHILR